MNDENKNIEDMGKIITGIFQNISVNEVENSNNLSKALNKILVSIKSFDEEKFPNQGEKLASHTKIIDLKKGILILETDHPGWTQLLHLHKKYILNGLKKECSNLDIKNIAIKLSGQKENVFDTKTYVPKEVYNIQVNNEKEIKKSLEKQVELIEKNTPFRKNAEIPTEIKKLFENMI